MGNYLAKPLKELTKEDVAIAVEKLGFGYTSLAELIRNEGVDGSLLADMDEEV